MEPSLDIQSEAGKGYWGQFEGRVNRKGSLAKFSTKAYI